MTARKLFQSEIAGALTLVLLVPAGLLLASFWPSHLAAIVILGSLRVHLALAVLVLAVPLALAGRWRRALIAAGLVLVVFAQMVWALAPYTTAAASAGAARLKVMSFNVLHANIANGGTIAKAILSSAPDIAFIQEARPLRDHLDELRTAYPYQIGCGAFTPVCDTLFLSRYPISAPTFYLSGSHAKTRFFITHITFGGRKLELAAMHLTKVELGAYQSYEYTEAAARIARLSGPVIVAGDFNTAPWAPRFVRFLETAHLTRAAIEPATWPGDMGTLGQIGLPIDHILVRDASIAALAPLGDNFGSNHRGLMAEIAVPAP